LRPSKSSMNLSFQYPVWFLIFCALLGLGYALLLYFRDTTFKEQAPSLHRWLGVLRWLVVTLLSALLLSPLLKNVVTETKKPLIVLAQDQSESAGQTLTGEALDRYRANWQTLRDNLAVDYEVHELAFGDNVRETVDFNFQDKVTNLSQLLQETYDRYGAQNLGAIILASDGVYNEGSNPAYSAAPISAPVYAIALGDTTPRKDLVLRRAFHNKIAYLNDKFSVQMDVAATNCGGSQTVLTVQKADGDQWRTLQSIPISIGSKDFFTTKEIVLDADQPGVARYLLSLAKVPGEAVAANNAKEIFIDILDARQKILIVANAPHPDISALRQMLELNKNYQTTIAYANDPGLTTATTDFVIFHNLPSTSTDISGLVRALDERRTPRLFIAGLQTNYSALSKLQGLVTAQSNIQQGDDVQAKVATNFSAFSLSQRTLEELPKFNPVNSAFGTFAATNQAQVILWKRIGRVDTEQPLLAVGENNGVRTGIFLAEGLWKWRLFDYLQHSNQEVFDELFGKTIQYVSLKADKRKFRVSLDKNIFNENENVLFGAELYNDNYELTNDPDVALLVKNKEGKEFTFNFNKQGKAYTLDAGILPVGSYTYRASTTFNGQPQVFDGQFSVRALQLELFETVANHAVLRQLAQKFGGEVVRPDDLTAIAEKIKNKGTIKPVIYQTNQTKPLINLKWIFALLAGLLAIEWFLRRYFGAY
jgi:hypothetical protein